MTDTIPTIPAKDRDRRYPMSFRLTDRDLDNLAKIRRALPHLASDIDAVRDALETRRQSLEKKKT